MTPLGLPGSFHDNATSVLDVATAYGSAISAGGASSVRTMTALLLVQPPSEHASRTTE